MNPHYHGGPPGPPNVLGQHYSRRQQEYHQYQQPGPHNPYAYPYPPQYYGQPMPMPYQMPRWAPQQAYSQYGMPPPMYQAPRSPLVVSSQPHYSQASRPMPYPHAPLPQSPYSNIPTNSSVASLPMSSPREPPSASSTPQPVSRRASSVVPPAPTTRMPYYPQLPWHSSADAASNFPPRAVNPRRRRRNLEKFTETVSLPRRIDTQVEEELKPENTATEITPSARAMSQILEPDTVQESFRTTAPVADNQPEPKSSESNETMANGHRRTDTKPIIPIIPALPHKPKTRPQQPDSPKTNGEQITEDSAVPLSNDVPAGETVSDKGHEVTSPKAIPKSWADLVRSKGVAAAGIPIQIGSAPVNVINTTNRNGTIGEVLNQFDVRNDHRFPFLEPRGLVNTGNMCYMNSILQVLVFCIPFYDLLDQVGKRATHSFKGDTPLLDAIIMFMREYKVIDSAESAEKLRMRLKDGELEQYGDPLIPEYVYSAINRLPRFSSMRRGHQQDAEEFLGFLLAGLHDECVAVSRSQSTSRDAPELLKSPSSVKSQTEENGWLEVGPKQKAAITRQSGDPSASSPVTRIFGGALRSELRVPGLKNSVTLEPYQPLQLDIGAPNINNIVDALKGLTKPESLTGDFNSPRGPGTTATKQVFIESLPPILILHLKRFQYDSSGGTQKIWKRIGYPLDLEMPKEVFPPAKRGGLTINGGLPKYRLTAVVYHHGKSAAGGHYTVDLLRQDRSEWVRVDDTLIRRVRPEDVAEGGAEEDPKVLAKALEIHQKEQATPKQNPYEGLGGDQDNEDEGKAWNDVNGSVDKKRWAGVAAATGGTATPSTTGKRTPRRDGVKDNKVAYILLYERVSP